MTRHTWFSFERGVLHCDHSDPFTQEDIDSIWRSLPMTGAAWVERGELYVQDCDPEVGGRVFVLGPVASGVRVGRAA